MSKIITRKQLKMVMENTMKEADYMNENEDAIKLTKDHMDKLNKEGHCMCDDKCLVYPEAVYGDSKKSLEVVKLVAEKDGDCIVMEKEHMDMLHKDGKCECDNNVTLSYEDDMKEGDYMNHMGGDYMSAEDPQTTEKMCEACGGTMVEGICEGGCGDIDENFVLAADEARDKGEKEFEYPKGSGKMHPVTIKADIKNEEKEVTEITVGETKYKVVEESVNKLTESLSKNVNKEIIKEDMDFFNKMINYNKK